MRYDRVADPTCKTVCLTGLSHLDHPGDVSSRVSQPSLKLSGHMTTLESLRLTFDISPLILSYLTKSSVKENKSSLVEITHPV